ncbi:MAG TPA: PilW family protein [Burkholderiales bacterium]|nr:PilW family protein [Burkholderiales bacterium]
MMNAPRRILGRPAARQTGLSLVELMVGLTIGLFLTLGLFTLIANSSQSFKVQDDFSRMQENATAALRYMGDSIRMAGFVGYAQDPALINAASDGVATTTDCGSATNPPTANWALNMQVPIYGIPGSGAGALTQLTVHGVFPCIIATNFQSYSPILVTRGAGGYRIPDPNNDGNLTDGLAEQPNYNTTIYVQSAPAKVLTGGFAGLLFYGNDFAALRASNQTPLQPNGSDSDIFEYHAHVYYIRPCSRPAAGTTCDGVTDDAGFPIPTLARQELVGSAMTEVPLVEGVDLISFQYGIDNNPNPGDGVADIFTTTPAAGDWSNVVAVRVSVLVRSPHLSSSYDDSSKQYDLDGDGVPDYACTASYANACKYKRKVFTQIFQLRNIALRRGA